MEGGNWIAEIIGKLSAFMQANGFSATMCAAGLFIAWRLGSKFMDNVAKPTSERVLALIDGVKEGHDRYIESTITSTKKMEACIENQGKTLDELKDCSTAHTKLLENHSALIGQIHENTKPKSPAKRK